jgi:hypothetical protein
MTRTTRLDQRALDEILDRQLNVIARHQALAAGMTGNALRHRLRRGGPWRSLLPGVYIAETGTPTLIQQEMAAMLYAGKGSVITGPAALRHHNIRGASAELIDVLMPTSRVRHDAGIVRLHRTTRMPNKIWELGPLRYAPPPRAVADTVRGLGSLRDVRAIVADAVQRGSCQLQQLVTELASGPTVGSALFREALTDVADGIRSTAEGDLKDLLARSRLPMPLFNPMVFAGEEFLAKPDAWWAELGVAVEVDSREWHMSPEDHAGPWQADEQTPDHRAQVHSEADPFPAVRGIGGHPRRASGRPWPAAAGPADRPVRRNQPSPSAGQRARRSISSPARQPVSEPAGA